MQWTRIRTGTIAALAALTIGEAALADMMVVRSVGPSAAKYRAGQKLADTAKVTLAANDQLVLLDAKGVKTLRGPGTFSVSAPAAAAPNRLAAIGGTDRRRERVGAVRAPGAATPSRPDVWYVDTGVEGPVCVPTVVLPTLWRGGAEAAGTTTITRDGTPGGAVVVEWAAGQANQPWPTAAPFVDGARYRLTGAGTPAGGIGIEAKRLAESPTELETMAKVLIAAGCRGQVDLVIAAAGGD